MFAPEENFTELGGRLRSLKWFYKL